MVPTGGGVEVGDLILTLDVVEAFLMALDIPETFFAFLRLPNFFFFLAP